MGTFMAQCSEPAHRFFDGDRHSASSRSTYISHEGEAKLTLRIVPWRRKAVGRACGYPGLDRRERSPWRRTACLALAQCCQYQPFQLFLFEPAMLTHKMPIFTPGLSAIKLMNSHSTRFSLLAASATFDSFSETFWEQPLLMEGTFSTDELTASSTSFSMVIHTHEQRRLASLLQTTSTGRLFQP